VVTTLFAYPRSPKPARASSPTADEGEQIAEIPAPAFIMLMIARDPAVQSELRLQQKQIDDVAAAVAEVDQPFWLLRDVPVAKSAKQLDELQSKFERRLRAVLTSTQLDRLNQIILQARGYKALTSSEIAQRLKLSNQQVGEIRSVVARAKGAETVDAEAVHAILSSEQQAELSALIGKSFDLSRVARIGAVAPELQGANTWINSQPQTIAGLRGKVVVVHFWAFGCINCVRNLPHYQSWYQTFPKSELVIVGIHTPETDREKNVDNLRQNVSERGIEYPVVFDAAAENWKAWGNHMWPSVYLIDKQGRVRNWWYGELNWDGARGEEFMRKRIAALLAEK
jgi:peroxiredoxin